MLHGGISALTRIDEIQIDQAESDMLAASIADVMAQFDLTPDPRIAAIAGLVSTCAIVYGPRTMAYKIRTARERAERKEKANTQYGPFGEGTVIDGVFSPLNG